MLVPNLCIYPPYFRADVRLEKESGLGGHPVEYALPVSVVAGATPKNATDRLIV